MPPESANSLSAFGFLTVLEDPQHGFFGGYLVLSELGRPLEFHCSTPVYPNEAQKILYGASLRPYVLGEIIGQTLVAKGQLAVQAVVTDVEEMLSLTLFRDEKMVCVEPQGSASGYQAQEANVPEFALGNYRLFGTSTCAWRPEQLAAAMAPLCSHVELTEPFQRIREAIREAQRITETGSEGADEHSSAA